jgi:phosphomannomutase
MLTAMVASRLLERHPDAAIVYNLICSRGVPELIEAKGGRPIRSRVGHSYIKETMRRENAIFGGEHSGHFYFRDNWFADSGMAALLNALEMVSEAGEPLSEVIAPLDHRFRSGEINSEVADPDEVMATIESHYRAQGAEIDHLDGITVSFPTWWFNVRSSNTQPLLRLNLEADDRETLEEKTKEVLAMIRGEPSE